jgi:hypothetical protein
MNVESILRACAKPLRREEFGSAAQLANNEFGDGRYDNVEHIADALDGGRRAPGWFWIGVPFASTRDKQA